MCGIAGVALRRGNAVAEVYCGLERLEYRGYDSAGISVLCSCRCSCCKNSCKKDSNGNSKNLKREITAGNAEVRASFCGTDGGRGSSRLCRACGCDNGGEDGGGSGIKTIKKSGRVAELKPLLAGLEGRVAIGHTRWATHGRPSERNAHPHLCGRFSLVHNGIIENYRELKDALKSRGETFSSDTDSEVIVRLISGCYGDGLTGADCEERALKAVARTVKMLKGSFALAVLCEDIEGIIAVKYKSNAVVGFMKDGVCVTSDVSALPAAAVEATFLEDGDIALITAGGIKIFDFGLNPVNRDRRRISPVQLSCGKGGYDHYMLKEIYEDGRTLGDTVDGFFRLDLNRLGGYVRGADRIIITGCGTAYNAGLAAVRFFGERSGAFCNAEIAGELRYFLPKVTPETLVLVVSQSGETADAVEAARALKQAGARVVAVTNCGYSAVTRIADFVVPVCAGPEICVAATKSYVGQLAALYLISALAGGIAAAESAGGELKGVLPVIDGTLADDGSAAVAEACAESSAVFFLGRGADYFSAVEASLKLKEVSYIFSDAYPAGELKHGTLALIDERTLSVIIIGDPELADKSENALEQVVSRGGRAVAVTCLKEVAERLKDKAEVWLLPKYSAKLSSLACAAALQLIAYRTAVLLKRDPDKPRNLAKSVTVE